MPRRPVPNIRLVLALRTIAHNPPNRPVHSSPHRSSTVSLPLHDNLEPPTAIYNPRDLLRKRKFDDLTDCLSRKGNPSRVWAYYTDLLNFIGYEKLPLDVHQEVLRKCTASARELRVAAARRLIAGNRPKNPHVHEGRFQTIIRNIRATGVKPTVDDYHFILDQFAAVGHHTGAMQVYRELTHLGLEPKTKTFGLCLQAIAHRLTLPCLPINRPRRVAQTRKMIADLMNDMQKFTIPFTSVNLDLTIRILKETSDREGFEMLLKMGYGIDLNYPDRPPLEYFGTGTFSSDLGVGDQIVPKLPTPQPFSTAALNTTVDMLGRLGDISKLVQAFEVLTTPLPPHADQHFSSSFDDEDDFGVSSNPPPTQQFLTPHATPNTTTYNTLLRHVSRAGHAVFARHYVLQAMLLDRQTDRALRNELRNKPLDQVLAPHFSINRGTLLSPFGETNRDKNVGLMRWIWTKFPKILRRKKNDLAFYTELREKLQEVQQGHVDASGSGAVESRSSSPSAIHAVSPDEPPNALPNASAFLPSSALSPGRVASVIQRVRRQPPRIGSAFNVNVDVDSPPSPPAPTKYFDIDLHLRVLQRDIQEIETFSNHVMDILGRSTQRVKERLGRRVWNGKDIYLLTDGDKRRRVSRQKWGEIVQFKPRHRYNPSIGSVLTRTPEGERGDSKTQEEIFFLHNREVTLQQPSTSGRRNLSTLCRNSDGVPAMPGMDLRQPASKSLAYGQIISHLQPGFSSAMFRQR